jgi:hypothetical protein
VFASLRKVRIVMMRVWLLRGNGTTIASLILLVLSSLAAVAQDSPKKSDDQTSTKHAAIEAWRVEMNYVKTNQPNRVNGFLVGSGSGRMGTIKLNRDAPGMNTDAFTCSPIEPISAGGDGWSSFVGENYAWSMSDVQLKNLAYPILGMVKTSGGEVFTLVPATFKAKIDIAAGDVLSLSGYSIASKRAIKAGDSFYVLMVGKNVLSVESADGANYDSKAEPWFVGLEIPTKASVPAP